MIEPKQRSWLELLFTLKGSTLSQIWLRVLATTLVALVLTWTHEEWGWFPQSLTVVPFTLVGLALSIFLGFRNTTSYDRFWEGRRLWGALVNTSRSFCRQVMTWIGPHSPPPRQVSPLHRELVLREIGFVHALRMHLRGQQMGDELTAFFSVAELASYRKESNPPNAMLQGIADRLQQAWQEGLIDRYHLPMFEQSLVELTNIQGACERIRSTPIPFGYTVLLHRIVAVYCFLLPFGIVEQTKMFTPLVVMMVSYAFLGLDAIGDEIEDPFGFDPNDLPLSRLSRMIEINLRERLGDTELPPPTTAVDGVIH